MPPRRVKRYSSEEFCRRGTEFYTRDILPTLPPDSHGAYVAIDIETGMFEIDRDRGAVTDRLYARRPEAQPWLERVGYPGINRLPISFRSLKPS